MLVSAYINKCPPFPITSESKSCKQNQFSKGFRSKTPCYWTAFKLFVDNFALLGYYTASSGSLFPTFPGKLSVPSSGGSRILEPPRTGPIGCPETLVRNYHCSLRNNPKERSYQLLRGGCWFHNMKHTALHGVQSVKIHKL